MASGAGWKEAGYLKGDGKKLYGAALTCADVGGSVFVLKEARATVAVASFDLRVKFQFTNSNDRCAGLLVRYKSASEFFVATVCRATAGQPACVKLRRYSSNGVFTEVASGQLPSGLARLDQDTWYELSATVAASTFVFSVAPPDEVLPPALLLQSINDPLWNDATYKDVGLFASRADIDWDDFVIYDTSRQTAVELVSKKCTRSCPGTINSAKWCSCCFFDCGGIKRDCVENKGFCGDTVCRSDPASYCGPPPPTPAPTPATVAPTPRPTPALAVASDCTAAGRALNPDFGAGSTCAACTQYKLASNVECKWCRTANNATSCRAESDLSANNCVEHFDNSQSVCPDPCVSLPAAEAGKGYCVFDKLTSVVGGLWQCGAVHNAPASDACFVKAAEYSAECLAAVQRVKCSTECKPCLPEQVSSTVPFLRRPCKSQCDTVAAECDVGVVSTCGLSSACASDNNNCVALASTRPGDANLAPVIVQPTPAATTTTSSVVITSTPTATAATTSNPGDTTSSSGGTTTSSNNVSGPTTSGGMGGTTSNTNSNGGVSTTNVGGPTTTSNTLDPADTTSTTNPNGVVTTTNPNGITTTGGGIGGTSTATQDNGGAPIVADSPQIIDGLDNLYFYIIVAAAGCLVCTLLIVGIVCLTRKGSSEPKSKDDLGSRELSQTVVPSGGDDEEGNIVDNSSNSDDSDAGAGAGAAGGADDDGDDSTSSAAAGDALLTPKTARAHESESGETSDAASSSASVAAKPATKADAPPLPDAPSPADLDGSDSEDIFGSSSTGDDSDDDSDDDDDDDDDDSHPQPTQTQSAPVILTKDNVSEKENSSEENSGEENSGEAVQEGADDDDASSTSQTKQQITTAARDSSSSRSRSSSSSSIDTDIQQSENNTSANGNSNEDVSAAPQQRVPTSPSVLTEPSPSVAALRARAVDSIRRASNTDASSSKRPTMQSSPSRGKAMTLATPKLNMSTGRINVIGHAGGGGVSELREVLADFARGGVLPMDAAHAAPRIDERPSWACAALVGGSLRACAAGSGGFDTVTAALRLRALPAAQADAVMLLLRVGLHGSYGAMHKVVLVELIPTHIKRIKRARLQPNRIAARNLFGHFNAVLELTNEHDLVEDTFKKLVIEKLA